MTKPDDGRPKTLDFRYVFRFQDETEKVFAVSLDAETLDPVLPARADWPSWTRLEYHVCPECPLVPLRHERCPAAERLVDVVEFFRDRISFEPARVRVEVAERAYEKETTVQVGCGAITGLLMATSDCPVLGKLRPMVDTHLPFQSSRESTYRMISNYLMAQFFIGRAGGTPDWRLEQLVDFLDRVLLVNMGFSRRLNAISTRDANLNALATLNAMGELANLTIVRDALSRWERIFLALHRPEGGPGR